MSCAKTTTSGGTTITTTGSNTATTAPICKQQTTTPTTKSAFFSFRLNSRIAAREAAAFQIDAQASAFPSYTQIASDLGIKRL
jgi:hypothetical protein